MDDVPASSITSKVTQNFRHRYMTLTYLNMFFIYSVRLGKANLGGAFFISKALEKE